MTNLQTFALAALEGSAATSYLYFAPSLALAPDIAKRAIEIARSACQELNLNPNAEALAGQLTLHHVTQSEPPTGNPS